MEQKTTLIIIIIFFFLGLWNTCALKYYDHVID